MLRMLSYDISYIKNYMLYVVIYIYIYIWYQLCRSGLERFRTVSWHLFPLMFSYSLFTAQNGSERFLPKPSYKMLQTARNGFLALVLTTMLHIVQNGSERFLHKTISSSERFRTVPDYL